MFFPSSDIAGGDEPELSLNVIYARDQREVLPHLFQWSDVIMSCSPLSNFVHASRDGGGPVGEPIGGHRRARRQSAECRRKQRRRGRQRRHVQWLRRRRRRRRR